MDELGPGYWGFPTINAVTQPGTAVFGDEAEATRRRKLLRLLALAPGLTSSLSALLQGLGLDASLVSDFPGFAGANITPFGGQLRDPITGQAQLPGWNPGAATGGSFLAWQPGNTGPTQTVPVSFYQPENVGGSGAQSLLTLLEALLESVASPDGAPTAPGAGPLPFINPSSSPLHQFRGGGGRGWRGGGGASHGPALR